MNRNINLQHLMGEATRLVRSGQLADATRAIQQTLGGRTGSFGADAATATATAPLPEPAVNLASPWRRAGTPAGSST